MREIPYGDGALAVPDAARDIHRLGAAPAVPLRDAGAAIDGALARPLGSPPLEQFVEPGDRVAVVVPDATRYAAAQLIVPRLVEIIERAGASAVVRIANGTHRRSSAEELRLLSGGTHVPVGDRDCDDPRSHSALGRLRGGAIARVDAEVGAADKLVLAGTISFHYLAGFGGGGKLLAPGCADRATAIEIHRRCLAVPGPGLHPLARAGQLAGNPLQEAIREVLAMAPPSFLVQLELGRDRRTTAVFAGDTALAHEAAAEHLRRKHELELGEPLDWILASPSGSPFDRTLVQAHKALDAAFHAVRPGGSIVLVAACDEGPGSDALCRATALGSADAVEAELRERFDIGLHTALALMRKAEKVRCLLVSRGIEESLARGLGLVPVSGLDAAVRAALGSGPRGAILADGALWLPREQKP